MKRSTFLNGYAIVMAILMVAMNISAAVITANHTIVAAIADLWIWVGLIDVMGIVGIWTLIREARDERVEFEEGIRKAFILEERIRLKRMFQEMEDARNECELNGLENQTPEC
jgi:hypothetical protein